jgi:hypothetical protein
MVKKILYNNIANCLCTGLKSISKGYTGISFYGHAGGILK